MKRVIAKVLAAVLMLTVIGTLPSTVVQAKSKTEYYFTNHWCDRYNFCSGELKVTKKTVVLTSYWGKGKSENAAGDNFDKGKAQSINKKLKLAKNYKVINYNRISGESTTVKKIETGDYHAYGPITIKVVNGKIKRITFVEETMGW